MMNGSSDNEDEDLFIKFVQRMQLMGFRPKSDYQRVFTPERNRLWAALLKHIHPANEVEKVVKNLAIKKYENKVMLNHQLKSKLKQKREEIELKESRFEETKRELRALECKAEQDKDKIREQRKKVIMFQLKKADLNNSLQYHKDILSTAHLLQKCNESQPADVVETLFSTAKQDLAQFYSMVREKQNEHDLENLKESLFAQIRNVPCSESRGILLKEMEYQTQELASAEYVRDLWQDFENIKSLKNGYKSAMDKFLIAFGNAHLEQIKLVKQLNLKKEVYSTLLDSTIQLIQERMKFDSSSGSEAEIRKWLTTKLKCERKRVAIETCKKELSILKTEETYTDLMNTEEKTNLRSEIQMKVNNIRMKIPWLQNSLKQIEAVHNKLLKLMPEITKLCTQEDIGLKPMERAIRNMHSVVEEEMDLFMDLPLDKLICSQKEFEEHQLVNYKAACSNMESSFMPNLEGAPHITTQRILLRALESKFSRTCLKKICLEEAAPLAKIDKNELIKADDPFDEAALQNLERAYFSFEMSSGILFQQIEKIYKEWVDHPMQNALLSKLLEGKTFEDWMHEYDMALEE